jgi:superfamily I DNA/RNA helicase
LRPYSSRKDNSIGYCSIQSFKGLEAPVVIVTDIERVADNEAMALFYVAITRAVHRLIILANKAAKKDIINILTGGKNS